MVNEKLLEFIKEARGRGFEDYEIKELLRKKKWAIREIEKAFRMLKLPHRVKNRVCVFLKPELMKIISKRAKKNILTISEQVEDILRRSCVNAKKLKKQEEKLDDMLVSLFSRKK